MNTKHTPGPWISENLWEVNSQNEPLTICSLFKTRTIAETQANAKLIAAAPELLENESSNLAAFRAIVHQLQSGNLQVAIHIAEQCILDIDSAIKKATE